MDKIAQNIKFLRYMRNMSRYDFSKAIGIPQAVIKNWENLVTTPSITQLIKIADYCGVSLDWICGRKNGY